MRVVALLVCLLAAGCDSVVSEKVLARRTGASIQYCTHLSICFSCVGVAIDGKSDCGMKLSTLCPGTQPVWAEFTDVQRTHESGKVSMRTYERVVETTGSCQ